MKHLELLLFAGVLLVASFSLLLYLTDVEPTGQAHTEHVQYRALAKAPYTDLPYNNEPIEMPFAGRCLRDEGDTVFIHTVMHHFYDIAVDGCYAAKDGKNYYYDYFCVGSPELSQVWLRIYPNC